MKDLHRIEKARSAAADGGWIGKIGLHEFAFQLKSYTELKKHVQQLLMGAGLARLFCMPMTN